MAEFYELKHSAEQIDEQLGRVIDGSVVTDNADKIAQIIEDNTLSTLDETSDKPVNSKGVSRALWHAIIEGNGDTNVVEDMASGVIAGHTVRIYVGAPEVDYSGVTKEGDWDRFVVSARGGDSNIRTLVKYTFESRTPLNTYYDVVIPEGTSHLRIGFRAAVGFKQTLVVEDLSTADKVESKAVICDRKNPDIKGISYPVNKRGCIYYGSVVDVNAVVDSPAYFHTVIDVKEGDMFFIRSITSASCPVYMLLDKDGKPIVYTENNVDTTSDGVFVGAPTDGKLVVNAWTTQGKDILVIKCAVDAPTVNLAPYARWTSGYYYSNGGINSSSSVNSKTVKLPTFGYKKVRLTFGVATGAVSSSLCFFDKNRQIISSIITNEGTEKGYYTSVFTFPEGCEYFGTSLYNDYIEGATIELLNEEIGNKVLRADNVVWQDGSYVDSDTGVNQSSTVNSRCRILVSGYASVEILVNKTPAAVDPGLAFYDKNDTFIIGYQFPNFGGAEGAESTTDVATFPIPANAYYLRTSIFTNFKDSWYAKLYSESSNNYPTVQRIADIANDELLNVLVGTRQLYISEPVTDKYTPINTFTTAQLYAEYDALVEAHPMFFRRGEDLGEVGGKTIREYVLGYNGRWKNESEPTATGKVSVNIWSNRDNPKKLLLNAGMHGNEKTPCWGTMLAIKAILESNEPWALYLKSNFDIHIVACLNPVGFDQNSRYNVNGLDLNRIAGANEPERVMYMEWIGKNKDAFYLIDSHGTQGRYVYFPIAAHIPLSRVINKSAVQLSASLYANYKEFYNSIVEGYGDEWSPFVIAKETAVLGSGSCAYEILEKFGMAQTALETPDNLAVIKNDGTVDEANSGLIGINDMRCCKITKDIVINFLQIIGSLTHRDIV